MIRKFSIFSLALFLITMFSEIAYSQATATGQAAANIPIRVNQLGYRPGSHKLAVFVDPAEGYNSGVNFTPGSTFSVKRTSDHQVVFTGDVIKRNPTWNDKYGGDIDNFSGDRTWHGDFSAFTTPGEYYIECNGAQSYAFKIDDNIYADLLKIAMRWYYYQRMNIPITSQYGGSWTHSGCYTQDAQATDYFNPGSNPKDMSGGWWDAGDPTKYVSFTPYTLAELMFAYEISGVSNDDWNIPESGNGIPDMLDEIKWEMDWLLKMQNDNGGVHNRVTNDRAGCDHYDDPGDDNAQRYYTAVTTYSTAAAGASYAHFSVLIRPFDAAYADKLVNAAKKAYQYLEAHPNIEPPLTQQSNGDMVSLDDGGTNRACGADGGRKEYIATSYRYLLYANLFRATGEDTYKNKFHSIWDNLEGGWSATSEDLSRYAKLNYIKAAGADADKVTAIKNDIKNTAGWTVNYTSNNDAYGVMTDGGGYWWGFNGSICNRGAVTMIAKHLGVDPAQDANYTATAERHVHHMLGMNALNYCYLTNLGDHTSEANLGAENCVMKPHHGWYGDKYTNPAGPVPGALLAGPNSWNMYNRTDLGSPPSGQPDAKCFIDDNTFDGSWMIIELAIYYQSSFVLLLADLAGDGQPCDDQTPITISLNKSQVNLKDQGNSESVVVSFEPNNVCADRKLVTWTSNDESIATVSNGSISPVGVGTTTITATLDENTGQTVSVTVIVEAGPTIGGGTAIVDGTKDASYTSTNAISNILLGSPDATDLSAEFSSVWDASNLYVHVSVTDNDKVADSGTDWPQDDVVEIYIDADNSKNSSYDGVNDIQYGIAWNGTLYEGGSNPANANSGVNHIVTNSSSNSYEVEISIPWSTLGVTPQNGNFIGLDVHVIDDDFGGDRENKIAWNTTVDDCWKDPSLFASVKLSDGSGNLVPKANAGADQTITLPDNQVTVTDASGNGGDGTLSYNWTKTSGGTATISNGNTDEPTFSNLVQGVYVFKLTVTDADGDTDTDEISVTVNEEDDLIPTANAGNDIEITLPVNQVTVTDASGNGGDGTLSYNWTKKSGGAAIISNENTVEPTFSNLEQGSYVFELTVTDEDGDAGNDEITIIVNPEQDESCDTYSVPASSDWIIRNSYSNQGNSPLVNENNALKLEYAQWAKSDFYLIMSEISTEIAVGEDYNVSFDIQGSTVAQITNIEVGFASGYTWDGPTGYVANMVSLNSGASASSFDTKEVAVAGTASGTGYLTILVTLNGQPNAATAYWLKNVSICTGDSPDLYALTVQSGSGDGNYQQNEVVTITADAAQEGQRFAAWTGATVDDANSATTTITMPAYAVTVTATYEDIPTEFDIAGKIEAEAYDRMSGIQTESCSEGGSNVGWVDVGDYLEYDVVVEKAGTYNVTFRVASQSNGTKFDLKEGSTVLAFVNSSATGGWQNWESVTKTISLSAGSTTLRIQATGAGWNINWMDFVEAIEVETYTLTVVNGSGSGEYEAGASVTITADTDPDCQAFTAWSGVTTSASRTTTFNMPANDATATANYADDGSCGGGNNLPMTLQAEDGILTGVFVGVEQGQECAVGFDQNGDNVTWNNVDVGAAGNYDITLRYQNNGDQRMKVIVNGNSQSIMFPNTNWAWGDVVVSNVAFNATGNTITYEKDWGYTRLDYIIIEDDPNKSATITDLNNKRENSTNFLIYPNPSKGNFTINVFDGHGMIEIYSIEGQKVYSYELTGESEFEVAAGILQTGMYIVKFNHNMQKLIIK